MLQDWKTTFTGVAMMLLAAYAIFKDPSKISDPTTLGLFTGGIGLLKAADSKGGK
jgi:multidrug transporter EmrE-like cation transporter